MSSTAAAVNTMGCDDYYDPGSQRRAVNWGRNNKLVNDCGCKRIAGNVADYVACCKCGAMVWTGSLWEEDDLPFVRVHDHWHELIGDMYESAEEAG